MQKNAGGGLYKKIRHKLVFVLFSKYTGEHDYEVLHKLVVSMQLNWCILKQKGKIPNVSFKFQLKLLYWWFIIQSDIHVTV